MVPPISNTKLRIPKGFQSLLVGLSTEILRTRPKDINVFAAEYFEKLLKRREQGQAYSPDKQAALDDRFYNSQSFQESFPVDDPDVQNAAKKIQAQFRGHKARKELEKVKTENKQMIDEDPEELSYRYGKTTTMSNEYQKPPYLVDTSANQEKHENYEIFNTDELDEQEKRELERAAVSIQAQFRGFRARKNLRETFDQVDEQSQMFRQPKDYDEDRDRGTNRWADGPDSGENLALRNPINEDENNLVYPSPSGQQQKRFRDDFEQRDSNFIREQQTDSFNDDDDDMSDPTLDKAATRIQASYRGYKTRKELGSSSGPSNVGPDQHHPSSTSPESHNDYDSTRNKSILSPSAEGNKEPEQEEDDNAAAVKIQAAYRGYRVRKDLEK